MLKRLLSGFVSIALLLSFALATEIPGYRTRSERETELSPGVVYHTLSLTPIKLSSGQSQRLFWIEVDPEIADIAVTAAVKDGHIHLSRMKTTELCAQAEKADGITVLAAVNSDYFDTRQGGMVGYNMKDGRWLTLGEFPDSWATAFDADGRMTILRPNAKLYATVGEDTIEINALNAPRADSASDSSPMNVVHARQDNFVTLYTTDYGEKTYARDGGFEIRIAVSGEIRPNTTVSGTVVGIQKQDTVTTNKNKKNPQGTVFSEGEMVLSVCGDMIGYVEYVQEGDKIEITCTCDEQLNGAVTVTGGGRPDEGPLLLKDGQKITIIEKLDEDEKSFYKRNPRTIAAVREDGTWFLLLIEGNRSGSYGAPLSLAQDFLLALGAKDAMNLDGGPSSTMAVRNNGKIKLMTNTTGSGNETKVAGALIICEK